MLPTTLRLYVPTTVESVVLTDKIEPDRVTNDGALDPAFVNTVYVKESVQNAS
jgi:hypothetical protein